MREHLRQPSVLHVDGVTVRFGAVTALNDVSFAVEPGTIHAVIGPNGAGKSTLFNVLTSVYRVSEGSVRYADHELTGMRPHAVAGLGIARTFQNIELSHTTVAGNFLLGRHQQMRQGTVAAALRLPGVRREEREQRRAIEEIAEFVGLRDRMDVLASELPYGDQKRVDLGRALAADPSVLLLDEPVAGMTRSERSDISALIRRTHEEFGLTVVLVEHDMPLVMGLAQVCTVLDFGTVVATGEPRAIRSNPAVIEAYLGGVPNTAPTDKATT
ncbi:ABC transporter ATP-binding protein [Aeromicrobium sp. HA]|uniref:ABC transporter ATP-binding protein n=1 Tax=Aeromicrobium sp. HA TaxID=3009077 RepID=UPI0022AE6617|nr:ABC transporter ATP-binding protein [Aeromicrobium sp. HA]